MFTASAAFAQARTEVLASGLLAPSKVRLTAGNNLLVAESGDAANQGRVSLVSRTGNRRTLVAGLPAGVTGQAEVSGPNDAVAQGRMLYVLIGVGNVEAAGPRPSTTVPNPNGIASPLFSSLLSFRFPFNIDETLAGVTLTAEHQIRLADGETVSLTDEAGATVEALMVANLPDTMPDANTIYRGSNPYAMSIADGQATIADASLNRLTRIDLATGRTLKLISFPSLPNNAPIGPARIDAVPDSILAYDGGYLVSSLSGFPFGAYAGRVEHVNLATGVIQPFIMNLTMPVDLLHQSGRNRFVVVEFSANMLAQAPGRLKVFDSPEGRTVLSDLITPTSVTGSTSGDEVYVTELAPGRLLRVTLQ